MMDEHAQGTPDAPRIAVVEDDTEIRDLVASYLAREGFEARGYANGTAFDQDAECFQPDLVVLDLMMPGEDGLSICRRVAPRRPVLVLSAKGEELDRIIGLEVGADDYLAKPFNPRELVARIRAILRRRAPGATAAGLVEATTGGQQLASPPVDAHEILAFEGWILDVDGRRLVDPSGNEVQLSSGEFTLLTAFARRNRRVLSREQLLDWTRGDSADTFDRAIDVQLSRLRRKMTAGGGEGLIKTIRGDGYLFSAEVARSRPVKR